MSLLFRHVLGLAAERRRVLNAQQAQHEGDKDDTVCGTRREQFQVAEAREAKTSATRSARARAPRARSV